jgi:flagellar biosynthesis protein FlhG
MANFKRRHDEAVEGKFFFPVGSGKGGVGKSLITANLGMALATLLPEKRISLLDADLGIGNLHLFLGIRHPKLTLNDFLGRTVGSLSEVIEETAFQNLCLLSGANGILYLANPNYQQKMRLINALKSLSSDILILDLSPGCGYNTIDFFGTSTRGIIVSTPEPTSIQAAYLFLRSIVYRKLIRTFRNNAIILPLVKFASMRNSQEKVRTINELITRIRMDDHVAAHSVEVMIDSLHPYLVLNMVQSRGQLKIRERFQEVVKKYLAIELRFLEAVPFDKKVMKSVRTKEPLFLTEPRSSAVKAIFNIADRLLEYEGLHYKSRK